MTISLWQRLDQSGRSLAPAAVTVMLVLLGMVPVYLPGYERVVPSLALMSVYYWAIHRPDLIRPSAAFAIGLLQDILSGTPLGMTALVLVLCHWLVVIQRAFFLADSFVVLWTGFGFIMFGSVFVQWLAYSMLTQMIVPIQAPLFQALLTLAIFPMFAWLFIRVHRAFLREI
ncbi:MAG: rod shape-determining protein MreD [Rhodospirillaceae bacterium]